MTTHQRHLELVDAVNAARTENEHHDAKMILRGFRDGLHAAGCHVDLIGCDFHTMEKHGERDMVCGVLLDWAPTGKEQP